MQAQTMAMWASIVDQMRRSAVSPGVEVSLGFRSWPGHEIRIGVDGEELTAEIRRVEDCDNRSKSDHGDDADTIMATLVIMFLSHGRGSLTIDRRQKWS